MTQDLSCTLYDLSWAASAGTQVAAPRCSCESLCSYEIMRRAHTFPFKAYVCAKGARSRTNPTHVRKAHTSAPQIQNLSTSTQSGMIAPIHQHQNGTDKLMSHLLAAALSRDILATVNTAACILIHRQPARQHLCSPPP